MLLHNQQGEPMTTVYLWNEGWTAYTLGTPECDERLRLNNITIGDGATIGYGVKIGYRATIGYGVKIGDRATIGDGATIGYGVKIGYRATIGYGVKIGDRATVGDGVKIGDRATIGDGATIGYGVKITQSLFITGSQNTVTWYGTGAIHIGCHCLTIAEWVEHYAEIGTTHGYTQAQIDEYKAYIDICAKLQETTING
jgi:UDP-3-O-[3-hydroxymyristoyl] glucosamine N-acyltransferase